MAMIKCVSCGRRINDSHNTCPFCHTHHTRTSRPVSPMRRIMEYLAALIAAIIVLAIIIVVHMNVSDYFRHSKEMSTHYERLSRYYEGNKIDRFIEEAAFFRQRGEVNYKNVRHLTQTIEDRLIREADAIPPFQADKKLKVYKRLALLNPEDTSYGEMVTHYKNEISKRAERKQLELKKKEEGETREAVRDREMFVRLLKRSKIYPGLVTEISEGLTRNCVRITVANPWHYQPYQIRLQMAQNLWKAWAKIHTPTNPDLSRITIVDRNGNEVGSSGLMLGSSIKVKE